LATDIYVSIASLEEFNNSLMQTLPMLDELMSYDDNLIKNATEKITIVFDDYAKKQSYAYDEYQQALDDLDYAEQNYEDVSDSYYEAVETTERKYNYIVQCYGKIKNIRDTYISSVDKYRRDAEKESETYSSMIKKGSTFLERYIEVLKRSNKALFDNVTVGTSKERCVIPDINESYDEQMDALLDNFQERKWSDLLLEEQKQSITDLACFIADDTGNENPPEIDFRDDMGNSSYGGYNPDTNTIEINVNLLDDPYEAADTIAHEMWHAYQEQAKNDLNNPRAGEYREGIDNYIKPEIDFEGYENQMIEAEARDYAQGFKDRLAGLKGAV